jgi:hypothetical protein
LIDVVRPGYRHWGISGARRIAVLAEAITSRSLPTTTADRSRPRRHPPRGKRPNFFIQHVPLPHDPKDREMRAAIVSGGIETPATVSCRFQPVRVSAFR